MCSYKVGAWKDNQRAISGKIIGGGKMRKVYPMMADYIDSSELDVYLNSPAYVAEEKFDGSRYVMQITDKGVILHSRRESVKGGMCDKTNNVPHITQLPILKKYVGTIFDGEIVSPDSKFLSVMSVMGSSPERAIETQKENGLVSYMVFDILEYEGKNVRLMAFLHRRNLLEAIFKSGDWGSIKLTKQVRNNKGEYYKKILKEGGEGIILKNWNCPYIDGERPKRNWIKIKRLETYDGIVIGGQEGNGKYQKNLGALLIGQYIQGELKEVAKISGMTDEQRKKFWAKIKRGEKWVVEFEAQSKTPYFRYRHPRYVRDRNDKNFKDCVF